MWHRGTLLFMNRDEIVSALNEEIANLTAARDFLMGASPVVVRGRGRPKGSTNKAASVAPIDIAPKIGRTVSADGKARIAEAQRKRWAAQKAKPAKKSSRKQSSSATNVTAQKKTGRVAAEKVGTTRRRKPLARRVAAEENIPSPIAE